MVERVRCARSARNAHLVGTPVGTSGFRRTWQRSFTRAQSGATSPTAIWWSSTTLSPLSLIHQRRYLARSTSVIEGCGQRQWKHRGSRPARSPSSLGRRMRRGPPAEAGQPSPSRRRAGDPVPPLRFRLSGSASKNTVERTMSESSAAQDVRAPRPRFFEHEGSPLRRHLARPPPRPIPDPEIAERVVLAKD